jgi:hypothetical protein
VKAVRDEKYTTVVIFGPAEQKFAQVLHVSKIFSKLLL